MMTWISLHWELLALLYCFCVLCFLPVSSVRLRAVDFFIVAGACGLLVTGFLRLV